MANFNEILSSIRTSREVSESFSKRSRKMEGSNTSDKNSKITEDDTWGKYGADGVGYDDSIGEVGLYFLDKSIAKDALVKLKNDGYSTSGIIRDGDDYLIKVLESTKAAGELRIGESQDKNSKRHIFVDDDELASKIADQVGGKVGDYFAHIVELDRPNDFTTIKDFATKLGFPNRMSGSSGTTYWYSDDRMHRIVISSNHPIRSKMSSKIYIFVTSRDDVINESD